jgi:hypothetical protein
VFRARPHPELLHPDEKQILKADSKYFVCNFYGCVHYMKQQEHEQETCEIGLQRGSLLILQLYY